MTLREFVALVRGHNRYHGSEEKPGESGHPGKGDPWAGMKPGTFEDYWEKYGPNGPVAHR